MQFGANASNSDKAISVTLLVLHIQRKRSNKYELFMNQWQVFRDSVVTFNLVAPKTINNIFN